MEDRQGLQEAYALDSGIFPAGDTLYVAGTKSLRDVWDDLKIPFGATRHTQRYEDASRTQGDAANPSRCGAQPRRRGDP